MHEATARSPVPATLSVAAGQHDAANKRTTERLAVFGGDPAFTTPLYVGRPNAVKREQLHAALDDILDRRWYTNNGPYVQELEHALSRYLGVEHCVLVCNGTLGLELALRATGLTGQVIVPAFTFAATVHALLSCGLTPVFADVDPLTHCIDKTTVEHLITAETTGILGVHLWGHVCHNRELEELAEQHQLTLLYDAAHAFGCGTNVVKIGNFGLAEVFSFHATKFFNTFEGGAITTNDSQLADELRLLRNFGFAGTDLVVRYGTNAKMHEMSAAMGLVSLSHVAEYVAHNRSNYDAYRTQFADLPGLRLLELDETQQHNYQYIVVDVDATCAGLTRDELLRVLHAENVFVRRYFYPGCHRIEPYASHGEQPSLPVTERLCDTVMLLPTGDSVTGDHIEIIGALFRRALLDPDAVRSALKRS